MNIRPEYEHYLVKSSLGHLLCGVKFYPTREEAQEQCDELNRLVERSMPNIIKPMYKVVRIHVVEEEL